MILSSTEAPKWMYLLDMTGCACPKLFRSTPFTVAVYLEHFVNRDHDWFHPSVPAIFFSGLSIAIAYRTKNPSLDFPMVFDSILRAASCD